MIRRSYALLLGFGLLAPLGAHAGDPLPDLTASAGGFEVDLDTSVLPGDVAELCASATTGVDLLRFDATTYNVGAGDLSIGDPLCPNCVLNPGADCGNPNFHCSPAGGHNHAHFTNYARYELLLGDDVIRTGGKFGFCLEDTSCTTGTAKFDCDDQGLTAGCEDLYSSFLGCQYIEVTGLPSGEYTMRVTVDPNQQIPESDEANNAATYPVTIEGTEELDDALPGTSLEVKARQNGTRRFAMLSKATTPPFGLPSAPLAPTIDGAVLSIEGAGGVDPVEIDLPAANWKGLGRPPGETGYRYKGAKGEVCSSVKITRAKLVIHCTLPAFVLPAAGPVSIVLGMGDIPMGEAKRYCALFGGEEKKNDAKKLRRVDAVAGACPQS